MSLEFNGCPRCQGPVQQIDETRYVARTLHHVWMGTRRPHSSWCAMLGLPDIYRQVAKGPGARLVRRL